VRTNESADDLDSFSCCCKPLPVANQLLLSINKIIGTFSNADAKFIVIKVNIEHLIFDKHASHTC
jgi:hypothetical protein